MSAEAVEVELANEVRRRDEWASMCLSWLVNNLERLQQLGLEAEDFPKGYRRILYQWLEQCHTDGVEFPDSETLTNASIEADPEVYKAMERLHAWRLGESLPVRDVRTLDSALWYAKHLQTRRLTLELSAATDELANVVSDPGLFTERAGELARETARRLADIEAEQEVAAPSESVKAALEEPNDLIPLGWTRMDDCMGGGLPRGDVFTVLACTTVGKTAFALNTIEHVLLARPDEHVVFFSLEMPRLQVLKRSLTSYPRTTLAELRRCLSGGAEWPAGISAEEFDLAATNYHIFETQRTVGKLYQALAEIRGPLALVVVDYVQLLQRPGVTKEYEAITQNMYDLKAMAKRLECGVLLLSQVPREVAGPGQRPTLRHGKGSGAIEDASDFVLGLWRPNYEFEVQEQMKVSGLEGFLLKAKHGFPGPMSYEFDLLKQRIMERPDERRAA